MQQGKVRSSTLNTSLFRRFLSSSSTTLSSISYCLRTVILSLITIHIVFVVLLQSLFRHANLEECSTNRKRALKSTTTRISQHTNETIAICATVKHESAYMDEWADYNLGLGFATIYVYDNSDRFEMEQWGMERRSLNDSIFVFHQPGWGAQCAAYFQCAKLAMDNNHTWVFFTDVDEFLILKQHINVADFAAEYIRDGQLSLMWQVFGTGDKVIYEPLPVTKRFQLRTRKWFSHNREGKSIVKLSDMDLNGPCVTSHEFALKRGLRRTTDGHIWFRYALLYGPTDVAYINHYYFRSYEENIVKRTRGDAWIGKSVVNHYIDDALNRVAKDGQAIPIGNIFDDTAWEDLKRMAPKYVIFDELALPNR